MNKRFSSSFVFDLVFSMRPLLLVPVWGFSVFGFWHAHSAKPGDFTSLWQLKHLYNFIILIIFSLSVGAVYILNQIADLEVDKKNGGLPLIASGIVPLKPAVIFTVILSLVSILTPLLLSLPSIAALSLLSIVTGVFYSFKPTFFSGRPFFDFLTNSVGYGFIAFAAGWSVGGKPVFSSCMLTTALPYFFLMCAGSISSTIPDLEGDKVEGKCTTAVYMGVKNAHILATLFLCFALIMSILVHNPVSSIISLACLPIYVLFVFYKTDLIMEATYKVGGVFCMFGAMVIFPQIVPVALFVFLSTWLYFRIRHGVSYPSLVVVRNDS